MKTLIPYLVLFLLIFVVACETDDPTLQDDAINLVIENNSENSTPSNTQNSKFFKAPTGLSPEAAELERVMQWTAYITADVLYNDSNARTHFINSMSGVAIALKPSISVYDVLGNSISDTDPFKAAFRLSYRTILLEIYEVELPGCRPGGSTERPPTSGPGGPGGSPIFIENNIQRSFFTEEDIDIMVDEFMDYIITDECLEIYFPIGITDDVEYTSITSSAHPLKNRVIENTGYYRIAPVDDCPVQIVNFVNVNPSYATFANGPIVIARPKRSPIAINCTYSEYSFSFTDFMQ